jgi:hypothetical protein
MAYMGVLLRSISYKVVIIRKYLQSCRSTTLGLVSFTRRRHATMRVVEVRSGHSLQAGLKKSRHYQSD